MPKLRHHNCGETFFITGDEMLDAVSQASAGLHLFCLFEKTAPTLPYWAERKLVGMVSREELISTAFPDIIYLFNEKPPRELVEFEGDFRLGNPGVDFLALSLAGRNPENIFQAAAVIFYQSQEQLPFWKGIFKQLKKNTRAGVHEQVQGVVCLNKRIRYSRGVEDLVRAKNLQLSTYWGSAVVLGEK